MRVHPGGVLQAEVRAVRVVGAPAPEVRQDSLDELRRLAENTYTNDPLCLDLTGQWVVLDAENARLIFGALQHEMLTVWSDQPTTA